MVLFFQKNFIANTLFNTIFDNVLNNKNAENFSTKALVVKLVLFANLRCGFAL